GWAIPASWQLAATFSPLGRSFRRRGEVEVLASLLGVADKLPVVGEAAAVAVAEMLEDDLACSTKARRHFEEFDQVLGGESAGKGFAGRRQGGECCERAAAGQPNGPCRHRRSPAHLRPAGIGEQGIQAFVSVVRRTVSSKIR